MLERVHIICFAASYAVALALEVSRLLFRSGVRGAAMLVFAGAGLVAHSAYLYYRAIRAAGSPLSSEHDWYLIAAWALVVCYLYLVYYHPRTAFGVFLLPLVLGLIATAKFFAGMEPFAREPASRAWGVVHGVSILLATVSVLIGFAAGLMYLGQARRLKHKLPPIRGLRLPSLEWLQRANSRAIVVSVLMMGLGVVSGVILKVVDDRPGTAGLPWYDPVVLSSGLMFAWLLTAMVFSGWYKPSRQGRKVAYLTVVSVIFLLIALGVMLFLETQHGGRNRGSGVRGQGSGVRDQESGARGQESGVRSQEPGVGDQRWTLDCSALTDPCSWPTTDRLLSTAYRLPPTVYLLPRTIYCLPLTLYRRLPPENPHEHAGHRL